MLFYSMCSSFCEDLFVLACYYGIYKPLNQGAISRIKDIMSVTFDADLHLNTFPECLLKYALAFVKLFHNSTA